MKQKNTENPNEVKQLVLLNLISTNLQKFVSNSLWPAVSLALNFCLSFFFKHNLSLTRSGKINGTDSDDSNHYPYVAITSKTPYTTSYGSVYYFSYDCCSSDITGVIAPGDKWTASSRGVCLVIEICSGLAKNGDYFACRPYESSGEELFAI